MTKEFSGVINLDVRDSVADWDAFLPENREWYGTATLYVDDHAVTAKEIRTMTGHYALCGEGLCIGYDSGDSVSAVDYTGRFDYTGGSIQKVIFDVADDAYIDLEAQLAAAYARD